MKKRKKENTMKIIVRIASWLVELIELYKTNL